MKTVRSEETRKTNKRTYYALPNSTVNVLILEPNNFKNIPKKLGLHKLIIKVVYN